MKSLSHPHIVELYEVYETGREISLVMEFARGGELLQRLRELGCYTEDQVSCTALWNLARGHNHLALNASYAPTPTPDQARTVIRRVLHAIQHMHANNVCHRDLKPENILLVEPGSITDIKITDFGLSKLSRYTTQIVLPISPSNCGPNMTSARQCVVCSSVMKSFVGTPRYIGE